MTEFPPSLFDQLRLILVSLGNETSRSSRLISILEKEERVILYKYLETGSYLALGIFLDKSELDVYFLLRRIIYKMSLFTQ